MSTSTPTLLSTTYGVGVDVPITREDGSSEPEDSYTTNTQVTEMVVTPNISDASTSSSQDASKQNVSTITDLTSNANA
eukprot:14662912-Ditylum_brightwellii.AAC.1